MAWAPGLQAHLRGLLRMMSLSGGLKPRAVAGSPSVTRFTHSSCTGFSTSGRPARCVCNQPLETKGAHSHSERAALHVRRRFFLTTSSAVLCRRSADTARAV